MSEGPVPETVVIGVGNPLMGDDGLGIAVLNELRERWRFGESNDHDSVS